MVLASYVRAVIDGAGALGLDVDAILGSVDLTQDALSSPDDRVNEETVARLWEALAAAYGSEAVGVRLAECSSRGIGAVEYAARNCETLRETLGVCTHYACLVNPSAHIELAFSDGFWCLTYGLTDQRAKRIPTEFVLAYLLQRSREITGCRLLPYDLSFQAPAPATTDDYHAFFDCLIQWDQPQTRMRFTSEQMTTPIQSPDLELARVMAHFLDKALPNVPSDDVCARVRAEVLRANTSAPQLVVIAGRLGLSSRDLQRRLRTAGTSFRQLIRTIRMEHAATLLAETTLAVAEVAFVVGFSEPSGFYRAFRRAYQMSPAAYRADLPR